MDTAKTIKELRESTGIALEFLEKGIGYDN